MRIGIRNATKDCDPVDINLSQVAYALAGTLSGRRPADSELTYFNSLGLKDQLGYLSRDDLYPAPFDFLLPKEIGRVIRVEISNGVYDLCRLSSDTLRLQSYLSRDDGVVALGVVPVVVPENTRYLSCNWQRWRRPRKMHGVVKLDCRAYGEGLLDLNRIQPNPRQGTQRTTPILCLNVDNSEYISNIRRLDRFLKQH